MADMTGREHASVVDRFLCWLGRPRAVVAGRDCYCRACGEVIRTATAREQACSFCAGVHNIADCNDYVGWTGEKCQ